ncbi:hypothetical protein KJ966_12055 [bacterium]|nr:hypothetical protein [bacterium]
MKNSYLGVYFLCLIVGLLTVKQVVAEDTVRLTSGEWAPFLSEQIADYGIASRIVTEAFSAVNIKVVYGFFPWKRSYRYALLGEDEEGKQWHGTPGWILTEKRVEDFFISGVIFQADAVFFHLKTFPFVWNDLQDLRGLTIGLPDSATYPTLENAERRGIVSVERGGSYRSVFKKLLYSDINLVPQIREVGYYYLNNHFPENERERITSFKKVIQSRLYHLLLSKRHPENEKRIEAFNNGMKIIINNGLYETIYQDLKQYEN